MASKPMVIERDENFPVELLTCCGRLTVDALSTGSFSLHDLCKVKVTRGTVVVEGSAIVSNNTDDEGILKVTVTPNPDLSSIADGADALLGGLASGLFGSRRRRGNAPYGAGGFGSLLGLDLEFLRG